MKNLLTIVAVLVILVAGYSLLVPRKEMITSDTMMTNKLVATSTPEAMKNDAMMEKAGSYEAYSPEKLAQATNGKVILFFRASWCPTCKALDTDIKSNLKNIPRNVTILDVDYDNSADLKKKYIVTYQHTLVEVNADGSVIKKWAGSPTLASLIKEIK